MAANATLPESLHQRIQAVAVRVRWLRVVRGLGLLVLVLTLGAAAALLADQAWQLGVLLRRGLLAGWLGLGATSLYLGLIRPLGRRLAPADLAAVIEQQYPQLQESLTSSVELANRSHAGNGSPQLIARLIEETEAQTSRLDFLPAVPADRAVLLAGLAALALMLFVAPALVWSRQWTELNQRFFQPWLSAADLAPFGLEVSPGNKPMARGEALTITCRAVPRQKGALLPSSLDLVLIDTVGREIRQSMERREGATFAFGQERVLADFRYRVEAGDVHSATYQVQAIPRVELARNSPTVRVVPPEYARETKTLAFRPEPVQGLVDLTVLKHSELQFEVRFSRAAVAATFHWKPDDSQVLWFQEELKLSDDRLSGMIALKVDQPGSYRLLLDAEHGIRNEISGAHIAVRPDRPPQFIDGSVKFSGRPQPPGTMLNYERLVLDFRLKDDVGVQRADLEYFRVGRTQRDKEVSVESIPLAERGALESAGRLEFHLAGRFQDGDEVYYRLRGQDGLPTNLGGPNVAYYPTPLWYYPVDRWLKFKVIGQGNNQKQQDILADRDDLNSRLEDLKADLLKEQRGVYKMRQETRRDRELDPAQNERLMQLGQDNKSAGKTLEDIARQAEEMPELQKLADQARDVVQKEMRRTEQNLQTAGKPRQPAAEREQQLLQAEKNLDVALQRLEELKKENEQLAQQRLDQARVEQLADREKQLSDQAKELAARDPGSATEAKKELERLQLEQEQLAKELQRLAKESETVRNALEDARAEEARQLADKARQLAEAERELAKSGNQADPQPLAELARQQEELARQTQRFVEETRKAAELSKTPLPKLEQAQQAADALKKGDSTEALIRQTQAANDLERLANDLKSTPSQEQADKARQLAQKQRDLREAVRGAEQKQAQKPAGQNNPPPDQARQQELQRQTGDLKEELQRLAQQPNRSAPAQQSLEQAADATKQAQQAMKQAGEESRSGRSVPAQQMQQQAAKDLDRAAQQAAKAASLQTAGRPGNPQPEQAQAGKAVQQAQGQMSQAQGQLRQGQAKDAQAAMERASQALQQAARQLAKQAQGPQVKQAGQPNQSSRTSPMGAPPGGSPNDQALDLDLKKYGVKSWGELSGELRTRIVQDLKARYGEDSAQMIKAYFEQIAGAKQTPLR